MKEILLFLLLFYSAQCFACTCKTPNKISESEIENAGEIFIGTIVSIENDETNFVLIATFEIKKYLKGQVSKSHLTVRTSSSGGSCGLNFEVGQKWYVFSEYSDEGLYASLCGRSVQLTKFNSKAKRLTIGRKNYRKMKRRVRQDKIAIRNYLEKTDPSTKQT